MTNLAAKPGGSLLARLVGYSQAVDKEGSYALNRPQLFYYVFGPLLGWGVRMATGSGYVIVLVDMVSPGLGMQEQLLLVEVEV